MRIRPGFTILEYLPGRGSRVVEATCDRGHLCIGFPEKLRCMECEFAERPSWLSEYREVVTDGAGV